MDILLLLFPRLQPDTVAPKYIIYNLSIQGLRQKDCFEFKIS